MLTYLHVKNIALIDELEVDFNEGFNILTGETGAGKSIIIGSINAVLGNKTSKDFIRKGCDYALIQLVFSITSKSIYNKLEALGIKIDDELIITRKISHNGRSVYRINGEVVNSYFVKDIAGLLIDLHSQHEHQSLLKKKNHIKLLNKFLGPSIEKPLKILKEKIKQLKTLKSEISIDMMDDESRLREISFLEYEINEIESAQLEIGEDIILEQELKKMSHMQLIRQSLASINQYMTGEDITSNVTISVNNAIKTMQSIRDFDEQLNILAGQLDDIDLLIGDFTRELTNYADNLYIDEDAVLTMSHRMDLINSLKMKHGQSIEIILEGLKQKKDRLFNLKNFEEQIDRIKRECNRLEQDIYKLCQKLSDIRKNGAVKVSEMILCALKELNLNDSKFDISIKQKDHYDSNGWDDVEFMISTNVGETLKPLIDVASGGEISRVMLAMKSVLANYDDIDTLIFDEIDAGISGRTAQVVAEKMAILSRKTQLLCITHLPQIAAMADTHYLIEKSNTENKTKISMSKLDESKVSIELARLLSGAKLTDTVINNAKEMKRLANELKENMVFK